MAARSPIGVVDAITMVGVAARDPDAMRRRWHELDIAESVRFVPVDDRGEGVVEVHLHTVDRSRAGDRTSIGGVDFVLG